MDETSEDIQQSPGGSGFLSLFGTGLWSGAGSRIGNGWTVLLVIAAGLCDLLSLIPFAGDFIAPIFWTLVSILLWKKGCGFFNARRLATTLISMTAELIPAIQWFPATIIGAILVVGMVRFEEKTGLKVPGVGSNAPSPSPRAPAAASRIEPSTRKPLNVDGVRLPSGPEQETLETEPQNKTPALGEEQENEEFGDNTTKPLGAVVESKGGEGQSNENATKASGTGNVRSSKSA